MLSSSTILAVSAFLFSSLTFASPAPLSLLKRATVSPDGTCSGTKGYTCQGSNYGNSCGKYNLCGRDTGYSEISNGCQPAYGFCYAPGSVSPDGTCGGTNMFICLGSSYGNSCGPNNKCGSDAGYSGTGCQPQYGYCQRCTTSVPPSTTTTTFSLSSTVTATATASTTTTVSSGTVTSSFSVTNTVTNTATASTVTTLSTGTTTVTTTNGVTFQKRAAAAATNTLPALPLQITTTTAAAHLLFARATTATGAGLSCGTVISTGFTTTTISTTTTLTRTTTSTSTSTSTTTVPAATVSTTTTFTNTATITTTSTSTTTVPAATATVGVAGPVYSKAYERTDTNTCFYSGAYYMQIGVSDDPTNNFQAGVTQCSAACTAAGSNCQSFYFSDSTDPSGNEGAYCLLDNFPYQDGSVTCNYQTTTTYLVDYNKVQ